MAQKKKTSWKKREGVVYSTNEDFQYKETMEDAMESLAPKQQTLHVFIEKKGRGGKTVTIVDRFQGNALELSLLAKTLKQACGAGGSVKEGQILIQGDVLQKVKEQLKGEGYQVKG